MGRKTKERGNRQAGESLGIVPTLLVMCMKDIDVESDGVSGDDNWLIAPGSCMSGWWIICTYGLFCVTQGSVGNRTGLG